MAKRISALLAVLMIISASFVLAQTEEPADQPAATGDFAAQMMGGLGVVMIDGDMYYRVQLVPELSFSKIGLGLDVDLLFNNDGIRKEDWNPKSRWVRIIRYARWGQKRDVFYVRLGALDAATLGHGSIMYRYGNQVNDADRKIGMELDLDFGMAGFESVVSNFGRAEIYGGRGYVRPLKSTGIPIIKNFEVGATVVSDLDPDQNSGVDDKVTVFGADLGLPIINTKLLYTQLYYDFAKIKNYGSGNVVGISADLKFPGEILTLSSKLEQRFLGAEYLPQYFDRFYEVERYQFGALPPRKVLLLNYLTESRNGTYGELAATLVGRLTILGSYQAIHKVPYSGMLHFGTDLSKLIPNNKMEIRAAYDQKGINGAKDLFTNNENTLVTVEGGYQVYSHVMLYLTYLKTYEKITKDDDGNTIPAYYKSVEKFSPRLAVKFSF
ncbi:MAG: hypothetical protein A2509_05650 [Candidatus Edwardsbacteria bacterium RIFOXYD12_FULL_50_11]|jgi:hypothetical protein|uniref:Alginate export domain-containing protein n=1 Tax=Candidatus Edwardsbacteria bacterium GWF2_54_11 TaxID=1817851 RepID=A0A1F5RGF3_9BACT|nr:MAG: hypothetical protein A2502_00230 [Candidatus Edwardsbacteria bacterium RifOxyC12_full_54_24]OGF06053.1 MAG: hypothetical protein A2273_09700 [Candidatus Edwardsbacteria bacterium RifOxyA12_full_54_48]OGF11861.1 MAG: hypothetical protein A3K15_02435 [Candidatus Edwardsbacteria bacterium GWE2_54_12]OGF13509.1 MAG: hypothetical protein A2024_11330 [Candidatus Edwardsbacteria bacterium GWF2_54_11]OGF16589.1 MAG: hypothetical protein A2509_05650 [Candidatus Edwardsbacteria bacterium RIFOXYD1